MVGLDWAAPDFSTLSRRQKTLNVHLPYRGGTGPLNLFIDSTGIKSEGEGTLSADCCAIACRIRNGTPPQPEPLHGTTQLTPRAISVDPFGNGGADITAGAASRPSLPGSYCAQPCRPVDALCEATGPILDGPVLGPSGCRNPSPHRRAQPLHRSWRTRHRARRITPSGERGSLHFNRFVQQSPPVDGAASAKEGSLKLSLRFAPTAVLFGRVSNPTGKDILSDHSREEIGGA